MTWAGKPVHTPILAMGQDEQTYDYTFQAGLEALAYRVPSEWGWLHTDAPVPAVKADHIGSWQCSQVHSHFSKNHAHQAYMPDLPYVPSEAPTPECAHGQVSATFDCSDPKTCCHALNSLCKSVCIRLNAAFTLYMTAVSKLLKFWLKKDNDVICTNQQSIQKQNPSAVC
jgi:hypothetical protein